MALVLLWVTVGAVCDHARIPLEFSLPSQTMAASAAVAFMHVASEDAVTHAVFLSKWIANVWDDQNAKTWNLKGRQASCAVE